MKLNLSKSIDSSWGGRSVVLLVILVLFACHPEPPKIVQKELSMPQGVELFETGCRNCHDLDRTLAANGDEETWRQAVLQARKFLGVDLPGKEIEALVAYHVDQQKREAQVFQDKCQSCHAGTELSKQPLTREQVHALVQRMRVKTGSEISEEDAELIVNYHIREHRLALDRSVRGGLGLDKDNIDPWQMIGRTLFMEKCSSCHDIQRSIGTLKDEKAWEESLKKMQEFSKGEISEADVNSLISFHVKEQQRELEVFQNTCTSCHSGERFTNHSMSDEETLRMLRKMQTLAPDMITDDKVQVLFLFHQRQEQAFASLFDGSCRRCHRFTGAKKVSVETRGANLNTLVNRANTFFGRSLQQTDVAGLLKFHREREQREMAVFKNNCSRCHDAETKAKTPSREERIMQISIIQGRELNRKVRETIRTQIRFHQVGQTRG